MKRSAVQVSVLVYALLSWQFSCTDEAQLSSPCGTPATIVQENGCGFNFQLDDGTRLYPMVEECVDIFAEYRNAIGRKVQIGFEGRPDLDVSCTTAIVVTILCIEDVESVR